jgi:hypothetical protein
MTPTHGGGVLCARETAAGRSLAGRSIGSLRRVGSHRDSLGAGSASAHHPVRPHRVARAG